MTVSSHDWPSYLSSILWPAVALVIESTATSSFRSRSLFVHIVYKSSPSSFHPRPPDFCFSIAFQCSLFSDSPTLLSLCKMMQKFKHKASKSQFLRIHQLMPRNSSTLNPKGSTKTSSQRLKWCLDALFKMF